MIMNPFVSIIIPNFNRAHLITETLTSIQMQDYKDWECIIIDDHSTDNSMEVISNFIKSDSRFILKSRPRSKKKGANSCRNYGFDLSKGKLIQWFDSDDLMEHNHLKVLVHSLTNGDYDFTVGDTINFSEERGLMDRPYEFDRSNSEISADKFVKQEIGWITDDFIGRRELLKQLKFNENYSTDGDEYNFFSRLLHINTNGKFVNEILTKRRVHDDSLTQGFNSNSPEFQRKIAFIKYSTFLDIESFGNKSLLRWLLSGYMQYAFRIGLSRKRVPFFPQSVIGVIKYFGVIEGFSFFISILCAYMFKKGYLFLRFAKKGL
ncbi:glycosyltransferase family 2 protein [Croceiramulus getboli]|nr:glycosyltransferase family 2 protein [Flavobacteriaceae bacterium YJPT1-3]